MPYTIKTLPKNIKELSDEKQKQWLEIFDSTYAKAIEDKMTVANAEKEAFKKANSTVFKESIPGGMNEFRDALVDSIRNNIDKNSYLIDIVGNMAIYEVYSDNYDNEEKYQVEFKRENGDIILGNPEKIEIKDVIVKKSSFSESVTSFSLMESTDNGNTWDVCLIKAGFSKNTGTHGYPRYYPEETLKDESVLKLLENAPAMAYKFEGKLTDLYDHNPSTKNYSANQVGFFENVRFDKFKDENGNETSGVLAKFHILETAEWLKSNLKQAWKAGKNILGFSIDADGSESPKLLGTETVDWVSNISSILENTVVTSPAAGGQVIRLVASQNDKNKELIMNREELIALIKEKAPHLLEGKEVESLKESDLQGILKEALSAKKVEAEQKKVEIDDSKLKSHEDRLNKMSESLNLQESQINFKSKLNESKLPEAIKGKLKKQYDGKLLSVEEINTIFADEQDAYSKLSESFPKSEQPDIKITSDQKTKLGLAMDGLFLGEDQVDADGKKVKQFVSFKEAYATVINDHSAVYADPQIIISDSYWWMPKMEENSFSESYNSKRKRSLMESARMQESLVTTDWAEILGNALNKAMMKEWGNEDYQGWRKLVSSIVPVRDFREQKRLQMGGYGILPTVAEQGTYQPVTSPQDTQSTYTPAKKGGLESITMEMVANDDVGAIRMVPKKLGKAAIITLYRDIFDMLNSNLEQDGSTTLASTARGNAASSAATLSGATFSTAVATMKKLSKYLGTSPDNVDLLGSAFTPRYLVIPAALEDIATRIWMSEVAVAFTGAATDGSGTAFNATEPNIWKGKAEPIVVPYMDATSETVWWMVADPKKAPTIEVGFFNGKQEPELFVQDNPTVGSVFTADKISYKVRYIYGFGVQDYRSFYRSA